jgi:hypothetical protein
MSQPPRFVPTLTEVVTPSGRSSVASETRPADEASPRPVLRAPEADLMRPPRGQNSTAPDLRETPAISQPLSGLLSSTTAVSPPDARALDTTALQEQLVARVLERVQVILDQRIRDAVAQVLLEHTEELALQLHETIDGVVKQTVNQAFAHELGSSSAGRTPVV